MDKPYKVEVLADSSGVWAGNQLRYATKKEAEAEAIALALRWTSVSDWRVVDTRIGEQPDGS